MEQTLGKRIAEHRKRLGLTQDALAEKLGITAQAVSKWENDQSCPDIAALPKLADIFGITIDALLGQPSADKVFEAEVIEPETADADGVHVQNGNWEFHWDGGRKHALFFAIWVLLVGIAYLAAKWLALDASFWDILWPSFLLVFGIADILRKFSVFKLGVAVFGGYFLVRNLGVWQLDIAGELVFPICIVVFGVGLLVDALRKPRKPKFTITKRGENGEKTKYHCRNTGSGGFECELSFGAKTYQVEVANLSGGEISCSFGELVVDLSDCEAVTENCQIEADCAFGSIQLLVPKCFAVHADSSTAFASVDFKGHPDPEPKGIIRLEANASFGEIQVKYI